MAKPTQHEGKWRIRWVDENGKRRSKTFSDRKAAALAIKQEQLAVQRAQGRTPPARAPDQDLQRRG